MAGAGAGAVPSDVWSALSEFIGDVKVHGSRPSGMEVPVPASAATDAISRLLAVYPLSVLFDLLRQATVAGNSGQARCSPHDDNLHAYASMCVAGCCCVCGCGWVAVGWWLWAAVGGCGWVWVWVGVDVGGCVWVLLCVCGCGWVAVDGRSAGESMTLVACAPFPIVHCWGMQAVLSIEFVGAGSLCCGRP
jgi:hypothetical protein